MNQVVFDSPKEAYVSMPKGGRLRAPVFKGLREDITVEDTHL